MNVFLKKWNAFWEFQWFGVCTKLGDKLGISSSSIRKYFIYISFLAYGSPIIIYLALAFIIDMRKSARQRRSFYYDL
jgi:phage shock protein C